MNAKKKNRLVGGIICVLAGALNAADVVWTGAVNSTWDTSTLNWLAGDESAAFAARDNVVFDDTSANATVTAGNLAVGRIVFSNEAAYVLNGGGTSQISSGTQGLLEVPRFEKRGAGKLTITGFHSFTGDVLIAEGCVETATPKGDLANAVSSALGNPRVPRTVTVSPHATLSFFGQGPTGAGTSSIDVKMGIEVRGGTLNLQTNYATTLGNVLFDNATFVYAGGLNADWRTMTFNGDWLKFSGTNAYTLPWPGSSGSCGLSIGRAKPVEVWVDDITSSTNSDVIWQLPVVRINRTGTSNNPGRFTKTGTGTLELACGYNTFTGDVRVAEGTLACSSGNAQIGGDVGGGLGSPLYAHTVYVGTNATLALNGNDIQGQFYNSSKITVHVDGGTLSQGTSRVNGFGPLILENATLSYSGRSGYWGDYWPTFGFNGAVTFKGTNAYTLASNGGSTVFFGGAGMSDVIVEDITQNADADVTIGMPIVNGLNWYQILDGAIVGTNAVARPAQFRKKGAGTLALSNSSSTFTGDVEVAEGVLQASVGGAVENKTYSALGNPQVDNRQIRVCSGGEVYFLSSDTLGQLASSVKMATVISNGTLRLANYTCNGFGPLTLYNATVIYNGGTASSRTWGVMGFGGKTIFDGTNVYAFAVVGSNCRFSLGYGLDFYSEVVGTTTNYHGKTEFEVRDITADADADVTSDVPLQDIPDWSGASVFKGVLFKCGLLKTGKGTLRLTSTSNSYTDPTAVAEGVLRVDGSLTTSAVTVKDGGYLGGTGTVSSVTLEDGARFDVFANQTVPLKVDSLTLEGGVTIIVHNPDGIDKADLNVPFLKVTGTGSFDKTGWTVLMDGVDETPNLNVSVDAGGTVYARWAPRGTLFKLL